MLLGSFVESIDHIIPEEVVVGSSSSTENHRGALNGSDE